MGLRDRFFGKKQKKSPKEIQAEQLAGKRAGWAQYIGVHLLIETIVFSRSVSRRVASAMHGARRILSEYEIGNTGC